ncbi:54S ribosomal protein L4 mitochondrial [Coemansia biformis]|uniref:Large ribosomal subunit protein uL29m n=1 Tax=Coemansia biformis TaxID=1286918 RepID=A0A9W8CU52_9FUNG|nr:54S ribosomal protein L4 mitochondrial [Coemansia biformis]
MFGRIGIAAQQLSARRTAQCGFLGRGLGEFFDQGVRLPKKRGAVGRAWSASELRQKSWEDLQKLWYVVLKERNVLASQKEERHRLAIAHQYFPNTSRVVKCKKTMARIKTVLNERRVAWECAQKAAPAAGKTPAAGTSSQAGEPAPPAQAAE